MRTLFFALFLQLFFFQLYSQSEVVDKDSISEPLQLKRILFFESGNLELDPYERFYFKTFNGYATRYINCEIVFDNLNVGIEPQEKFIQLLLLNAKEEQVGEHSLTLFVSQFTESPFITHGWGWNYTESWDAGKYRLLLLDENNEILGEESFQISYNINRHTGRVNVYAVDHRGDNKGKSRVELQLAPTLTRISMDKADEVEIGESIWGINLATVFRFKNYLQFGLDGAISGVYDDNPFYELIADDDGEREVESDHRVYSIGGKLGISSPSLYLSKNNNMTLAAGINTGFNWQKSTRSIIECPKCYKEKFHYSLGYFIEPEIRFQFNDNIGAGFSFRYFPTDTDIKFRWIGVGVYFGDWIEIGGDNRQ